MKMYQRINRKTGIARMGLWEDLCDLDVRVWHYATEVVE